MIRLVFLSSPAGKLLKQSIEKQLDRASRPPLERISIETDPTDSPLHRDKSMLTDKRPTFYKMKKGLATGMTSRIFKLLKTPAACSITFSLSK